MADDRPPPMPGVTWAWIPCPACGRKWWHGVPEDEMPLGKPVRDPLRASGLAVEAEALLDTLVAFLGACGDCRAGGPL